MGKPEKDHLKDLGIDVRIALTWIFKKYDRGMIGLK
jgi:hypothetical protein